MRKDQGKKVPKKIQRCWNDDACRPDLERYRLMAIEWGADDAKVIESNQVILEERVRGKCSIPKCVFYGTNLNCPPHSPPVRETKAVLREYKYGIFIKLIVPSDQIAGEKAFKEDSMNPARKKLFEIVSSVESQAFYDGYHLAMGFGGGPCKKAFCPNVECSALVPGKGCRYPLWARSSMESVGMNAFTMAARVGWDVYPIARTVSPDDVPHGTYLGLVLIY